MDDRYNKEQMGDPVPTGNESEDAFPEDPFARVAGEGEDEEEEEEDDDDEDDSSESSQSESQGKVSNDLKEGKRNDSESVPALRRISVIRHVKDVEEEVAREVSEESSPGSSLVMEEDSDTNETRHKISVPAAELQDCEPSADPAEVECIATDTSDDESTDDCDDDDGQQIRGGSHKFSSHVKCELPEEEDTGSSRPDASSISCDVCDFDFQAHENPKDLLKHMQSVHKFAVRGLEKGLTEVESSSLSANVVLSPKKPYICTKDRGGCGAVFYSRQGLSSHHNRSQSAGGTCWVVSTFPNDHEAPLFTCALCSLSCDSRRLMLRHLEAQHKCKRGPGEPAMAALALDCRICGEHFWSVRERSKHEVTQHPDEAAHLVLKCYACSSGFSSKICLKKHVSKEHPDKEHFSGTVGFRCRICCITFPILSLIQAHFRQCHPTVLVFRCQRCNLILKTKKTFMVHLKSTECGAVRRECTICKKVMWSKRAVSIHYRMKHSNTNRVGFLCRICKKRFDSKADRKLHYLSDHEGDSPFHCPICNKGFASKSGMYGHRQTHVKTGLSKCEFCGKEFSRRDSYNEHLLIHTGPRHKCPHCDKEFVQRSNLVRHIRIHTGEKPYKCSFCEKTFSDKGACNSHIRVHTREEACGCPYCGQVFSKKQKLKYHIRKHTGEGLVSCEFCGKTFTNSHSLKEHRMIHDRQTQILCSQCGKAFTTSKYLQRHIAMVHEALCVYNCPLCARGFSQQGRLKAHLMTHTGIKHLRCLLCTKAYSSRKSLRRHLLGMHGVPIEHPDYKRCFYAMTPEETGLTLPDTQLTPQTQAQLPLLQPKSEPLSDESDSNGKESSSDESSGDGPPQLERQESCTRSPAQTPFMGVRTKAAMKQLPFSLMPQRGVDKKSRGNGCTFRSDKSIASKRVKETKTKESPSSDVKSPGNKAGARVLRHVSPKVSFFEGFDCDDSSASSASDNLRNLRSVKKGRGRLIVEETWRPGKGKGKKKGPSPRKASQDISEQEVIKQEGGTEQAVSCMPTSSTSDIQKQVSVTEPPKSNRRARYKSQTPKKRVVHVDSDQEEKGYNEYNSEGNTGQKGLPQKKSQELFENQSNYLIAGSSTPDQCSNGKKVLCAKSGERRSIASGESCDSTDSESAASEYFCSNQVNTEFQVSPGRVQETV